MSANQQNNKPRNYLKMAAVWSIAILVVIGILPWLIILPQDCSLVIPDIYAEYHIHFTVLYFFSLLVFLILDYRQKKRLTVGGVLGRFLVVMISVVVFFFMSILPLMLLGLAFCYGGDT